MALMKGGKGDKVLDGWIDGSDKKYLLVLALGVQGIHGHRTSKAPHPVRSAQLTGVPPS